MTGPLWSHRIPEYGGHLLAIRRFFLQPQESYAVEDLAALWRVRPDDVCAIYHDELARTSSTGRIEWADAAGASIAFTMLRPVDIERALGSEFGRVRPDTWRTVPILVHLPKFVIEAVTNEPALPADLALEVRVEQVLIELYARHECRATGTDATEGRRQP